jgi:spoIIIJ-associated protein
MIEQEEAKIVENLILDFFDAAGFSVAVKNVNSKQEESNEILEVNLSAEDAQVLIGKQGIVLADIQLLLRKILKKGLNREIFLNLDLDSYKKKKEEYLRDLAEDVADEVAFTKRTKEIPMASSFDRRIVHMELGKRDDVIVESEGEGEDRHIVIRPKN